MSGQRPPEWEDPDDGHSGAGLPGRPHPDNGHQDLDPSEVTSFLASVRTPALPASFEARISAAIAAEAAARATTGQTAATEPADAPIAAAAAGDAKGTVRSANPEEVSTATAAGGPATPAERGPRPGSRTSRRAGRSSGPGDSRPGSRRRRPRMPSMQAASWVLVSCLVLAGFGFAVAQGNGSSSSSEAAGASASQSASGPAADTPQPATGRESQSQPEHDAAGSSDGPKGGFLVHSTGVAYQRSTLASQVRGQLANAGVHATTPASSAGATPAVSASASAASSSIVGRYVPSAQLSGCVSRLTGGVTPSLVDKASYDGIPAYIIAVPTQVWAVRLGCTATNTQLLAQVPLNG